MAGKLNSGWVLTVLRNRGLPLPDSELLKRALAGLDESLLCSLEDSLHILEKGGGEIADMDRVALLGRSLSTTTRAGLIAAGIQHTPEGLLQWCMNTTDAHMKMRRAIEGISPELEEVRNAVGQHIEPQIEVARNSVPTDDRDDFVSTLASGNEGNYPVAPKSTAKKKEKANTKRGSYAEPEEEGITQYKVYGKSYAVTVELDVTRASESKKPYYTLRLESAKAIREQVYNWEEKIIFQLTMRELHQVVGVFLGLSDICSLKGHGDNQEKRCEIRAQSGGILIRLGQDKRAMAIPIGEEDLFHVAVLGFKTLRKNYAELDESSVMDILRMTIRATRRVFAE